jgi:hypothetical protein
VPPGQPIKAEKSLLMGREAFFFNMKEYAGFFNSSQSAMSVGG